MIQTESTNLSMLTQHNKPDPTPCAKASFCLHLASQAGTIRSKNKQAPQTKIGISQQELAVRLNRGKQAERRESERRDRDGVYRPGADSVVAIETARLG